MMKRVYFEWAEKRYYCFGKVADKIMTVLLHTDKIEYE